MTVTITLSDRNDQEIAFELDSAQIVDDGSEVLIPVDEICQLGTHFINTITVNGTELDALAVIRTSNGPGISVQFFGETPALPKGWEQVVLALETYQAQI